MTVCISMRCSPSIWTHNCIWSTPLRWKFPFKCFIWWAGPAVFNRSQQGHAWDNRCNRCWPRFVWTFNLSRTRALTLVTINVACACSGLVLYLLCRYSHLKSSVSISSNAILMSPLGWARGSLSKLFLMRWCMASKPVLGHRYAKYLHSVQTLSNCSWKIWCRTSWNFVLHPGT